MLGESSMIRPNVVHGAGALDPGSTQDVTALIVTALIVVAAVIIGLIARASWIRGRVIDASAVLRELQDLNARSAAQVRVTWPISQRFAVRVESKSKYDRFDLQRFMATCVIERESWFAAEIEGRVRAVELFSGYLESTRRIWSELAGRSGHPKVTTSRFQAIESRLFARWTFNPPRPRARVTAEVGYRSPKGQNSYSRGLTWDFDQLRVGLAAAQEARARQSTAAAMRARERSLMTPRLRTDILRRDGFRCRMCGAAAADGAELHIDHITPVSRGGRTLEPNLQTLCQSCNLGKGNRFIG